jgi:hypothetical protein
MVRIPFGRYLSRGSGWGDMFPLRVGAGHPPVVAPQLGGGGRLAVEDADGVTCGAAETIDAIDRLMIAAVASGSPPLSCASSRFEHPGDGALQ